MTRNLKTLTMLASTVLLSVTLTGCGEDAKPEPAAKTAQAQTQDLLETIKSRGSITIAMEGTWSPWTYHDKDGKLTGFDVAIGERIAQKIGVKAQFVEGKWDGLLAGLDAGRYDLMINGVGITKERSQAYSFSDPYAYDRVAVIVNDDRADIKTMQDLKGKTTANTISSTYALAAEEAGAKVIGVDDLNQTFELLRSRRIDATLNSEVIYLDYTKAHPDAKIKIALYTPQAGEIGIPLKKSPQTESLRKVVNDTIAELRTSGELGKISVQFFGIDITKQP